MTDIESLATAIEQVDQALPDDQRIVLKWRLSNVTLQHDPAQERNSTNRQVAGEHVAAWQQGGNRAAVCPGV